MFKRSRDHADSDIESEDEEPKDKKSRTYEVSTPMKEFLHLAFCLLKPLKNNTRRTLISRFGIPEGEEARCPKMDVIINGELHKEALESDKKLSRLQNFALDVSGPLVYAREELSNKETHRINHHSYSRSTGASGQCQLSHVSGMPVQAKLNPDLKSMAEEEDYSKVLPFLFGTGFEYKAKERTEVLKCLHKTTQKQNLGQSKKFF